MPDTTQTTMGADALEADGGSAPGRVPIVGDRVVSRFELTRVLGSGGMGVVFEARDTLEDEVVALKWLRRRGQVESLRREFRALSGLQHPNLTQYIDLFIDARAVFLTMERIDGVPLDEAFSGDVHLLACAFRQLASALGFLHAAGIVHCDLKPANVLVEPTGRVRVVDFGLAQHREAQPHRQLGTPAYAAPEVAERREHGPPADWYAFGRMLSAALAASPALADIAGGEPLRALARRLADPDPAARPGYAEVAAVLGEEAPCEPENRFVGRDAELRRLREAYESCLTGGVRWLDVRGPSGVGKSRLVAEACAALERLEPSPWTCWSSASERAFVSFRALTHLLSALAAREREAIVALSPAQTSTLDLLFARRDSEDAEARDRHAAAAALGRLLERLAAERPIVVVLDQLHVGDRDSAELLVGALERCPRARVLVVAICRSDLAAESDFLNALPPPGRGLRREKIELGPMPREEIVELVRPRAACPERVADYAEGLPWLALELARADAPTMSAAQLIRGRLARVSEEAQRLAELVAVAGHPLSPSTARSALRSTPPTAADVRALVRERIVREIPARGLVVHHDLVGEVLQELVAAADVPRMHARLAAALSAAAPRDHAAIATHLFAAGRLRDVVPHALEAADRASSALAFDAEARWLRRVLETGALDPAAVVRCRRRLGRALERAGRGAEAAREHMLAAAASDPTEARRDRRRAAVALIDSGRRGEGLAELERLAAEVHLPWPTTDRAAIAWLVGERLRSRLRSSRLRRWTPPRVRPAEDLLFRCDVAEAAREAYLDSDGLRAALFTAVGLRLALVSHDDERIGRALCDTIIVEASQGARSRVALLIEQARAVAARVNAPQLSWRVRFVEAVSQLLFGRFGEAARALGELATDARAPALVGSWELAACRKSWMTALQFYGRMTDAQGFLEEWAADAEARKDLAAMRFYATQRPLLHLLADRVAEARACERALRVGAGQYTHPDASALLQRAHIALYDDAPVPELVALRSTLRPLQASLRRSKGLRAAARAVVARLDLQIGLQVGRLGGSMAGHARVRDAVRRLRGERTEYADALASGLMAAFCDQRGDADGALEALEATRSRASACGMRLFAAAADLRAGEIVGGGSGRARARAAAERLRDLGVVRPRRYASVLLPGFARRALDADAICGGGA